MLIAAFAKFMAVVWFVIINLTLSTSQFESGPPFFGSCTLKKNKVNQLVDCYFDVLCVFNERHNRDDNVREKRGGHYLP